MTSNLGRVPRPAHERVLDKCVAGPNGCVIFTGALTSGGYGQTGIGSRTEETRRAVRAHRVVYEALVGPIPDGLTLDHLCRVPACVNPSHLEPVTMAENTRRGGSPQAVAARENRCKRGHDFDSAYVRPASGKRECRTCREERWALLAAARDSLGMTDSGYKAAYGHSRFTAEQVIAGLLREDAL